MTVSCTANPVTRGYFTFVVTDMKNLSTSTTSMCSQGSEMRGVQLQFGSDEILHIS